MQAKILEIMAGMGAFQSLNKDNASGVDLV